MVSATERAPHRAIHRDRALNLLDAHLRCLVVCSNCDESDETDIAAHKTGLVGAADRAVGPLTHSAGCGTGVVTDADRMANGSTPAAKGANLMAGGASRTPQEADRAACGPPGVVTGANRLVEGSNRAAGRRWECGRRRQPHRKISVTAGFCGEERSFLPVGGHDLGFSGEKLLSYPKYGTAGPKFSTFFACDSAPAKGD